MRDLVQSWWDAYDAASPGGGSAADSGFGGYEGASEPGICLSISKRYFSGAFISISKRYFSGICVSISKGIIIQLVGQTIDNFSRICFVLC